MPCLSGYEACPPPLSWHPPPDPAPPPPQTHPPPALKVVREWERVGVWPDATAPLWAPHPVHWSLSSSVWGHMHVTPYTGASGQGECLPCALLL